MLEQLFGSKARVKLLKLFFSNPEKYYFLRQLARDLKLQLNSVRREIENLENLGIIMQVDYSAPKAGQTEKTPPDKEKTLLPDDQKKILKKFYIINADFVLYQELRTLFIKSQFLLERKFIERVQEIGKLRYFALTGYFVGNDGMTTDILAVGSINRQKLAVMIKQFEKEINHEINYTVMNYQEFKYRKDITDRFLYNILENKKIIIINKL